MAFPSDAERQKWRVNSIWRGMIKRTTSPNHVEWQNYGARGIKVCERWRTYKNFYTDMAPTYRIGLTIERIDVNGDYEPGNCRWATTVEQARNKRNTRMATWQGRTMPLADWADELGISLELLRDRLSRGWTVERAFTTPSRRNDT